MRTHTPRLLVLAGSLTAASAIVTTSLVLRAQMTGAAGTESEIATAFSSSSSSVNDTDVASDTHVASDAANDASSVSAQSTSASSTSATETAASSSRSSTSSFWPLLNAPPAAWRWPRTLAVGSGPLGQSVPSASATLPVLPRIVAPAAIINVPAAVQDILHVQHNWPTPGAEGCFAVDGNWTTDRAACDADQMGHVNAVRSMIQEQAAAPLDIPQGMLETIVVTPAQPSPEEHDVLHQMLTDWFVGQQTLDGAQQELLAALQESTSRLDQLQEIETDPAVLTLIGSTAEWLHIIEKMSTEPQTLDQIQETAETVRDRLSHLHSDLAVVAPPSDVDWILFRSMDNYVYTVHIQLSRVLAALKENGIPVDSFIFRQQLEARRLYEELHDACMRGETECRRITEVAELTANIAENLQILVTNAGVDGLAERVEAAAAGR